MQSPRAVLYWRLWPVCLDCIFPHYRLKGTILGNKLLNIKCVFDFCTTLVGNISKTNKKWVRYYTYIGLYAKYPLFLPDFKGNLTFSTDFRIIFSIKFNENPSWRRGVVPCGRKDMDREMDRQSEMTKQIVHFHNFMSAPKNQLVSRSNKVRKFATPQ